MQARDVKFPGPNPLLTRQSKSMRIVRIMIEIETESEMSTQAVPSLSAREAPRSPATEPRTVDSAILLGSDREVRIVHEGETYRLCRTRQGKLILTK